MERLSQAAGHDSAPSYERHRPEETVLYAVVQSELETFLSRGRDRVVPAGPQTGEAVLPACCWNTPGEETDTGGPAAEGGYGVGRSLRRYPWTDLLRRVFAVDVLECPDCGGRMRILTAIHPPEATLAILQCLGLPSRAPPIAPARPEPASPEFTPTD